MSRESPAIVVDQSLSGVRVAAVLDRLALSWGLPQVIQVENGPEFSSRALDDWAHRHGVKLAFSRPETPTDNPYIEAFNGRLRAECLAQRVIGGSDVGARPPLGQSVSRFPMGLCDNR